MEDAFEPVGLWYSYILYFWRHCHIGHISLAFHGDSTLMLLSRSFLLSDHCFCQLSVGGNAAPEALAMSLVRAADETISASFGR